MNNPVVKSPLRQILGLIGWLVLCFSASATAVFISPGDWYAHLRKPSWTPPSWVFGPAWTLLYIMMATAAWLVWRGGGGPAHRRALGWFLLQWLLNALWTPLFFGLHQAGWAFAEILALWSALAMTLIAFWRVRPLAGCLLVPYLAWVSFATALNGTIWWLNR